MPIEFVNANVGYMHFVNGEFVTNRQEEVLGESANGSDFVYLELSFNLAEL